MVIGGTLGVIGVAIAGGCTYQNWVYQNGYYDIDNTDGNGGVEYALSGTIINRETKAAVLKYNHDQILRYSVYGKALNIFYNSSDFKVPSKEVLDGWAEYIKLKHGHLFSSGLGDVASTDMLVGNYGPEAQTFTTILNIPGLRMKDSATSIINYEQARTLPGDTIPPSNPFAVEFYQALRINKPRIGMSDTASLIYQEQQANQFGIAISAIEQGLSFEEYEKIASDTGFVPAGEIQLVPLDRKSYETLMAITLGLDSKVKSSVFVNFMQSIIGKEAAWYLESLPNPIKSNLPALVAQCILYAQTGITT